MDGDASCQANPPGISLFSRSILAMPKKHLFQADLRAAANGEVLTDAVSLGLYATDASLYQIRPLAVFVPSDQADVIKAVEIARDHKIALIPRGGGTGLAGQTIGQGLIIDFSKHVNRILELNADERWVRVEPGIVRDNLNHHLAEHRLHFAPDPATSSRANIGGMLGNNSSGTKSILYGKTVDHVLELKVLLSDGTILDLKPRSKDEYEAISKQNDREGEIYRTIREYIQVNREEIDARFPKVMRRVGGYNLDEFIDTSTWNLSKLIVGSEGTLGLILEAKINLEPLPEHKSVCLVHFKDLQESIVAVQEMVKHGPAAVEILDKTVIDLSRKNLTTQRSCHVVEGDPKAVLIVEFYGDTVDEVMAKPLPMIARLKEMNLGYAYPVFGEGTSYNDVWTIRKKGLGLMLGMKTKRKPLAFIEDAGIPLESLPEYIEEVRAVCEKYDTPAAMYAHASVGVIHVRPILDMRDADDIERFKNIAEDTFQLVKKYKGSWSGEHGDGLVRSPFNERFFGKQLYEVFEQVKQLFDPENLMNPGKIIHAPPIDQNLRYGTTYQDEELNTLYHYREDGSFQDAIHMCSGVGECRKTLTGTMCPSFMATLDEEHSTRGRANALRLAMSGQMNGTSLTSDRVIEALDLCLSCKACKAECPSNVDMAKLKSEVWQMKYDHSGIPRRAKFIRDSAKMATRFSGRLAPVINGIQKSYPFRLLLEQVAKIERQRKLPEYAQESFVSWFKKNYKPLEKAKGTIAIFSDTYLNHHEPSVGKSTVHLITKLGYNVQLADVGCCQRPKLSNGFLRDAKKEGGEMLKDLNHFIENCDAVLICEPSCASALHHDLPDLMEETDLNPESNSKLKTVASFVKEELEKGNTPKVSIKASTIWLHGHCHEKSLYGTDDIKYIFDRLGVSIREIPAGCCGMAGSFGYEKEHYALSEKIGRDRLFPALEKIEKDDVVIANGFSCRHQIEHFTKIKAKFWTEIFS